MKNRTEEDREDAVDAAVNAGLSGAASYVVSRYGSGIKEHMVAYGGVDNETGEVLKRGLKQISEYKVNPEFKDSNLKQQAGFAAETKEVARRRAEEAIAGKRPTTVRTDDIPGHVNDQLFDITCEVDANGNPVNHDLDMYEKIRDAVDYGIIHGYIRLNDANKYVLIKLKEETPAFIEKLKATLVEMKSDIQTRDANWIDALNEIEKREHRKPYVEIALDRNYKNLSLTSRQHILPEDDFSIKNIYRVVRADMEIEKLVFDAKKFYEESQFFYDIDNLINLNRTIELYLKANVAGLISHERGKGWSVKYSSNQFNKPIVFFEDKLVKSDDFDRPMYYLAVISAFAKVILEEKVVNGIEKAYAPYTWDRDAQPEGLVHHPSSAAFTKLMRIFDLPLFANEDTEIRNEAIDNYYKNSNYKDYYSYPLGYKNADTIFENLKLVIKAFEYFARYNSGLFVEEPKQDDESE